MSKSSVNSGYFVIRHFKTKMHFMLMKLENDSKKISNTMLRHALLLSTFIKGSDIIIYAVQHIVFILFFVMLFFVLCFFLFVVVDI